MASDRDDVRKQREDDEWVPEDDRVIGRAFRWSLIVIALIVVIAIALALPAGMRVLVNNIDALSGSWAGAIDFSVYLRLDVDTERATELADTIERRADVGFVGKVVPEGEVGRALQQYRMPPMDGPPPEQGFENFRRNLVSIVAVARADGATPVLLTQALWSPDPTSDDLKHGAALLAAHERMTDVVRAVAAERDVPLVDMKSFMADAVRAQEASGELQTLFTNNVHMTDEGAARFADHLAAELVRLGVL